MARSSSVTLSNTWDASKAMPGSLIESISDATGPQSPSLISFLRPPWALYGMVPPGSMRTPLPSFMRRLSNVRPTTSQFPSHASTAKFSWTPGTLREEREDSSIDSPGMNVEATENSPFLFAGFASATSTPAN